MARVGSVTLIGWKAFLTRMNLLAANMTASQKVTWWVVVGANYAVHVHDGARGRAARPFLQEGLNRVSRQWQPKNKGMGDLFPGIGDRSEESVVGAMAFAVEGESKRVITEMQAVDTGNLRLSIVAAPTVSGAMAEAGARGATKLS